MANGHPEWFMEDHWEQLVCNFIEPPARAQASLQGKIRPNAPDLAKVQQYLIPGEMAGSKRYSSRRKINKA